ncbi:hypothetical protein P20311_2817 [Pseudoalteromonas sp. BSi20311]|uniref:hypothetical protein n=1 Tax=Pseudoalteromonas sp. BSi20311 TaxID=383911 RepID=UPI000231AC4A|nr:hypothetical protein [Pseudoalteromonas sp. BSi20311]GAA65013.1 hypothetical protein P20311_2817 [Pseudoalteromonas sp. BSi20311]
MSKYQECGLNVFYVESPGQLINAMEAIYKFQNKWKLLIRLNGDLVNDKQIEKVLSFYMGKSEQVFTSGEVLRVYSFIGFITTFLSILLFNRPAKKYVGCHKSRFLKPFHLLRVSMTLMDDGIATLAYLNRLENEKKGFIQRVFSTLNTMDLFTALDLSKFDVGNVTVEKHNFSFLKSLMTANNDSSKIYFFGAKYIEVKILSEKSYEKLLTQIINVYRGKDVYYLPHRGEERARLNRYKSIGFKVYEPDFPSELELVLTESKPTVVAGFFTASLFTTSVISPTTQVTSFKIPNSLINTTSLNYIYDHFSSFSNIYELEP